MRTALIAGGSGLVGGQLLRQLLESKEYSRVTALVRRPLSLTHSKLEQVIVDFSNLEKVSADLHCDVAFCCLGTTIRAAGSQEKFRAIDQTAVLAFAWAAKRHGAQRFFTISSLGADAQSRFFYNRVKGETEEALTILGFPTLRIFRPSLLLGSRPQPRWGERIAAVILWVVEPLLVGRLKKYRAIEAAVVARAMERCSLGGVDQTGARIFLSDEIQDLGGYSG